MNSHPNHNNNHRMMPPPSSQPMKTNLSQISFNSQNQRPSQIHIPDDYEQQENSLQMQKVTLKTILNYLGEVFWVPRTATRPKWSSCQAIFNEPATIAKATKLATDGTEPRRAKRRGFEHVQVMQYECLRCEQQHLINDGPKHKRLIDQFAKSRFRDGA